MSAFVCRVENACMKSKEKPGARKCVGEWKMQSSGRGRGRGWGATSGVYLPISTPGMYNPSPTFRQVSAKSPCSSSGASKHTSARGHLVFTGARQPQGLLPTTPSHPPHALPDTQRHLAWLRVKGYAHTRDPSLRALPHTSQRLWGSSWSLELGLSQPILLLAG